MTDKTAEDSGDLGPGQQLKLARERKGYTVADISARLKLNTWIIEGIESEDYDNLPAPTFLRGYLRSYGAMVDLDGGELVRDYNRSATIAVKPLSMEQPEVAPPAPPVPVFKYLLILLLLASVMFATYWFAFHENGNDIDTDLGESLELEDDDEGIVSPIDGDVGANGASPSSSSNGSTGLGQPIVIADAGSADPSSGLPIAETVPVADSLAPVVVTPLSADDAASLEPVAPSAPVANSEPTDGATSEDSGAGTSVDAGAESPVAETAGEPISIEPAQAGYIRLNFTLAENAWMQIRERRNKRIVSKELPAGDHEFVGRLPVRMTIGNAKTVTLLVDGQPWDIPKRNVARIKIFKKPEPAE